MDDPFWGDPRVGVDPGSPTVQWCLAKAIRRAILFAMGRVLWTYYGDSVVWTIWRATVHLFSVLMVADRVMRKFVVKLALLLLPFSLALGFPVLVLISSGELTSLSRVITAQEAQDQLVVG